jgi:hypothetical protein
LFKSKSKINEGEKSLQLQIRQIDQSNSKYMKKGYLPRTTFVPLTQSGSRLAVILVIALTVVSSPFLIVANNPLLASTSSSPPSTSSTSPSELAAPSTISQSGDFTAQAPLQIPRTLQSTDLVNSLAFYEVTFITSTTGAIDKIRMDFPAGTGVGAAGIIERIGIGGGTLLKSGSSITYDVTSPVSIPAGTFIRIEMFGIKNPITPSTTFTAEITTRDSGGNLIDGPSTTNVYTIKKVGSSDIADGAVTSTKIATSLGYSRQLSDGESGWNPDGSTTVFFISDSLIGSGDTRIIVNFATPIGESTDCNVMFIGGGTFEIACTIPPADGTVLRYGVLNLPPA